ncbi:MAG: DUF87 domain-containing protein [Chloroflexia bacterium]|nr:DUF87 domain-containing protein [Chloroflexia bacterium]
MSKRRAQCVSTAPRRERGTNPAWGRIAYKEASMIRTIGYAGVGVLGLLVVVWLASTSLSEPSAAARARDYARAEQIYQQAELAAQWEPIRAAALNGAFVVVIVALAAAIVGLVVYVAALAGAHVAARMRYAVPDEAGRLPVPVDLLPLAATQALDNYHATQQLRASIQPVPHSLHYSGVRSDAPVAPLPTPMLAPEPPALPGRIDLAELDHRPSVRRILLGLGPGGEQIVVPARDLCHVALVGATGGGKTNALRLLIPQLQAIGGQVVLADPHYAATDPATGEDWRPIAQRLARPPAATASQIDALFGWLEDQLQARKELRIQQRTLGAPIFLAMDELLVISSDVTRGIDRITKLLREGRKYGMFVVGASQTMLIKAMGGDSSVRDAYRTAYYLGGDVRSAAALLDMPQRTIDDGCLETGIVYLRSKATSPAQLVRVPYASNEGILSILGGNDDAWAVSRETPGKPLGNHMETVISGHQDALDERSYRVADMLRSGAQKSDIIATIWGATTGRSYQSAAKDYDQIIANLALRVGRQ